MLRIGSKGNLDGEYQCKISLLDDTELTCDFKKDAKGQVIFDTVCKTLDLLEKDYFGLRYVDDSKQRHWLDLTKNVVRQMKSIKPPYKLFFRVKFYSVDPSNVHEEITRYQFFLQIKRDILHGRLLCSYNELAELGGYIVQADVGDYDPEDNDEGYVSQFRIVPKQSEKLEKKIEETHKQLSGQVPSVAEKQFLTKVQALDMYGVDPHPCKDQDNVQLYLGLTPAGIAIIRDGKKVSGFDWPQVVKVSYESKVFYVQIVKEEQRKANYGFRLPDPLACKHLWKCAVEHHAFYSAPRQENKVKRSKSMLSPNRFFRRNKFRYSGRTQEEVLAESEKITRPEPELRRTPSIRISRRIKPPQADNVSESTGDLALPTRLENSASYVPDHAAELQQFETIHFPESPPPDDSHLIPGQDTDVPDSAMSNHVDNNVERKFSPPKKVAPQPTKEPETEYYGFKMFIFFLFILALIMIPIAIVWETRKTYFKSTDAYKGFARWVYNNFAVRV